ncbi:hypothetical protein ACQHIH_21930 (plasmid) [Xanthomonas sontii]|uniref:hypothetical protein n=1 Tax=Xanthomonas sontii TaxID=2650745 RepID=UPI003F842AB3
MPRRSACRAKPAKLGCWLSPAGDAAHGQRREQHIDRLVAADLAAAYGPWLPIASTALLAEGAALPDDVPAPAALRADAPGLAAQRHDNSAQALQQFDAASAQSPRPESSRLDEAIAVLAMAPERAQLAWTRDVSIFANFIARLGL